MPLRKKEKSSEAFWKEYEEKTGETVLARSLGRYLSGWEEFDKRAGNPIWGLIIASSGGFRFHHFPQRGWFDALVNFSGGDEPKEKTIFIPKEKIISARINAESKWWKKIFNSAPPRLIIKYRDEAENEKELLLEVDYIKGNSTSGNLEEKLRPNNPS